MATYIGSKVSEMTLKDDDGNTVTLKEYMLKLVDQEIEKRKRQEKSRRITNMQSDPTQSKQWDFLLTTWIILSILSGLCAVLSAIIHQYIMSIIMALIFLGSLGVLFTGALRYIILALFLMVYLFGGFLLSVFYAVAMMQDFYRCDSWSCEEYRMFLFQINYNSNVFVAVMLFLYVRVCWAIIVHQRKITSMQMQQYTKEYYNKRE